jgi:hypothetical protein
MILMRLIENWLNLFLCWGWSRLEITAQECLNLAGFVPIRIQIRCVWILTGFR